MSTIRDSAPVPGSTSETRVVPGDYDGVSRAMRLAAASSGMTVTLADPAAGVIRMSRGKGLAVTWGESLAAHPRPPLTAVEVTQTACPRKGLDT